MASGLQYQECAAIKLLEGIQMRKLLVYLSSALVLVLPLLAEVAGAAEKSKDDDRLRNSGMVLREILDVPDDIPQDLLDKADCVVVFPSVLKAAFIVAEATGGALCRAARETISKALGAHPR
jgi:lipid-binding SYLF domain-containing protein